MVAASAGATSETGVLSCNGIQHGGRKELRRVCLIYAGSCGFWLCRAACIALWCRRGGASTGWLGGLVLWLAGGVLVAGCTFVVLQLTGPEYGYLDGTAFAETEACLFTVCSAIELA